MLRTEGVLGATVTVDAQEVRHLMGEELALSSPLKAIESWAHTGHAHREDQLHQTRTDQNSHFFFLPGNPGPRKRGDLPAMLSNAVLVPFA